PLADTVEPRRARPPESALVCARATPGHARLEMLGPFPAVLGAEDRAQVLHPCVQGARALGPSPLVGVVRIAEEVVVAIGLARKLCGIARVAVDRPESPRAIPIQIQLGFACGDQLRQRPAHATGAAEPVERKAGR